MAKRRRSRGRSRSRYDYSTSPEKEVDFAEEYRYVVSDLKRFGILALVMFGTLIALALIIG